MSETAEPLAAREPSAKYVALDEPALVRGFELLTTVPDGVSRLRELFLLLAAQGKLMPQDPMDEPANVLLARIRVEKTSLETSGRYKRAKNLVNTSDSDEPFEIPSSWAWTRLGEITTFGECDKATDIADTTWVLDLEDIEKDTGRIVRRATFAERRSLSDKNVFRADDVLYGKLRPYLNKVTVADAAGVCTTEILPFRGYGGINPRYLRTVMQSPYFLAYVNARSYGMKMPRLGTDDGKNASIPLPPLAEQHSIVARVEELMKLCDALEQSGRLADEQHARLASTLFDALAASESAHALAENWQRVAAHFDLLLDRPEAIDALERTILALSIQGRLVPQELTDLSAAPNSQLQVGASAAPINESEVPFEIPTGWQWIRLGWAAELINGDRGTNYPNRAEYVASGLPFINTGHIEPDGTLSHESMNYLTRKKFDSLRSGKTRPGDLVYCLRGATLGKTAVVEYAEGAIASSLVIIRLNEAVDQKYAYYFLIGPLGRDLIKRFDNGSAQPNLAANSVKRYVMPLPPIAEQRRIVARIAELRSLCTSLRQHLVRSQETQSSLADALVAEVT